MKNQVASKQIPSTDVLSAPSYAHLCELLRDDFLLSREAGRDPQGLFRFQTQLCGTLLGLQERRQNAKDSDDAHEEAVIKRVILLAKRIGDAAAWRVFNYDRAIIQLLGEHPNTGSLDDTVYSDMATAKNILDKRGSIVLVNDLTNVLRYGDITEVFGTTYQIHECKSGTASRQSRRATRQSKALLDIRSFLNTGVRETNGSSDYLLRATIPFATYHDAVSLALANARQQGSHRVRVSNCVAFDCIDLMHPDARPIEEPAFAGVEYVASFDNTGAFYQPLRRTAPYGIFPFDQQHCFDLLTGTMLLRTSVNLKAMQALFRSYGLVFEFPIPDGTLRSQYLNSDIAQRKKLQPSHEFLIRDASTGDVLKPDILSLLLLECIREDTLARACRELLDQLHSLQLPEDKPTRIYVSYDDEHRVWA